MMQIIVAALRMIAVPALSSPAGTPTDIRGDMRFVLSVSNVEPIRSLRYESHRGR